MSRKLLNFSREVNIYLPIIMTEFTRRQIRSPVWGRISLPQMLLLEVLYRRGDCIMKDLASEMFVSTPAITGLVDRMSKSGFVRRFRTRSDRRRVIIKLTDKGNRIAKDILKKREKMIQDIFSSLSGRERKCYLKILKKLSISIKSKRTFSK